jgi:hypothetical protein
MRMKIGWSQIPFVISDDKCKLHYYSNNFTLSPELSVSWSDQTTVISPCLQYTIPYHKVLTKPDTPTDTTKHSGIPPKKKMSRCILQNLH